MKKKSVFSTSKWSSKKGKLAVCIPCRDTLHSAHAMSLVELVKFNTMNDIDTHVFMDASTILLTQRERLATMALQSGSEHILWLDSDMVFPANIVHELLKHDQDMVACNYSTRTQPYRSVAFLETDTFENTLEKTEGLHTVAAVGLGISLIKSDIFENIDTPYFKFEWSDEYNSYVGEDIYFCQQITSAGYNIYVDASLSNRCAHIGAIACKMDMI